MAEAFLGKTREVAFLSGFLRIPFARCSEQETSPRPTEKIAGKAQREDSSLAASVPEDLLANPLERTMVSAAYNGSELSQWECGSTLLS